jgi:hypothetical protein
LKATALPINVSMVRLISMKNQDVRGLVPSDYNAMIAFEEKYPKLFVNAEKPQRASEVMNMAGVSVMESRYNMISVQAKAFNLLFQNHAAMFIPMIRTPSTPRNNDHCCPACKAGEKMKENEIVLLRKRARFDYTNANIALSCLGCTQSL